MIPLNSSTVESLPPTVSPYAYYRGAVRPGIAHISVGNFHRAHQAFYIDRLLHYPGNQTWGICGIGIVDDWRERLKTIAFPRQDNLYMLTEYPPAGEPICRVIGSIIEYIFAPAQTEEALRRLCDPAIRIVSMTITEGGYNIEETTGAFRLKDAAVAHDLAHHGAPITAFGYIVEALARRRAQGIAPFTVLSCDNLLHNGDVARLAVLSFARARDPDLGAWIEQHVTFPNSMVDRITPAVLEPDAARLNNENGVEDLLPVFCEDFVQWVIEDRFCNGRPMLEAVGAQFTDNVSAYEMVKLRMLNAAHSMLAYPALLAGFEYVHQAVGDPRIRALLVRFLEQDVIPLLDTPQGMDLHLYKDQVISRFSNPAIGDQVFRIAFDGASKIPVFLSDTARLCLTQQRDTRCLSFFAACFARYLCGVADDGRTFTPDEPHLDAGDRQRAILADPLGPLGMKIWESWYVEGSPTFIREFVACRERITIAGVLETLDIMLGVDSPRK